MPLLRLILRGNQLSDSGAFALCPLVQSSISLSDLDLSGNYIGRKGALALQKVRLER
ncbi:unnamed protein product [Sphacelaria rigidula]